MSNTEFGFYDDEETLREVEDYYDDLSSDSSFNELLNSSSETGPLRLSL